MRFAMVQFLLFITLLAVPAVAQARERVFTVTEFDRIRLDGPIKVEVTTAKAPSARATGDSRGLESLSIRVEGRTLIVRPGLGGWGGYPGDVSAVPLVRLATRDVRGLVVMGGGTITVDRLKSQRVDLILNGSGSIDAAGIDTDRLVATLIGAGTLTLAGRAADAQISTRGAGTIAAAGLTVTDLVLNSETAGESRFTASRTARVLAGGAGGVTVAGNAACTVRAIGTGTIVCGR